MSDQEERYLYIGMDPAEENWGTGIIDPRAMKARLEILNLNVMYDDEMNLVKVPYSEKHVDWQMDRLIERYDTILRVTKIVGIEKQMRRRYILMAMILRIKLQERYGKDGLIVIETSPKSVRALFGISAGGRYAIGKQKSYKLMKRFLNEHDLNRCKEVFVKPRSLRTSKNIHKLKNKKKHFVDAYEALIIALALYYDSNHFLKLAARTLPSTQTNVTGKKRKRDVVRVYDKPVSSLLVRVQPLVPVSMLQQQQQKKKRKTSSTKEKKKKASSTKDKEKKSKKVLKKSRSLIEDHSIIDCT